MSRRFLASWLEHRYRIDIDDQTALGAGKERAVLRIVEKRRKKR
jgi:hypothetical protein